MSKNICTPANDYQETINEIVGILKRDSVYCPKSAAENSDVCRESKLLFAVIFTECLKIYGGSPSVVRAAMKIAISKMSLARVRFECFCTWKKAPEVRAEVLGLIEAIDIAECISSIPKRIDEEQEAV